MKELSIENIKKEIIEKLTNNMEVLKYLEADKLVAEGMKLNDLLNNVIFDHDSSRAFGNYITVEVTEYDSPRATNTTARTYKVVIKIGLKKEESVCALSNVVVDIINGLYPDRRRYSNTPFVTVDNCMSVNNYGYSANPIFNTVSLENKRNSQLNRAIVFEIEKY